MQITSTDMPEKGSLQSLCETWTIKHSFFVIMGGYQFRPEALAKWVADHPPPRHVWDIDKRQPKSVLTVAGLLAILELGKSHKLPMLTVGDIDDRSKADGLAKLLSCVQGFWLLVQIISRLASKLVVTELEVNTLAHVLCALLMYAFWMRKPLKIEKPVWLEDEHLKVWALANGAMKQDLPLRMHFVQRCCQRRAVTSDQAFKVINHEFHSLQLVSDCETCRANGLSPQQESSILLLADDVTMRREDIISSLNAGPTNKYFFDFVATSEEFLHECCASMDRPIEHQAFLVDQRHLKAFLLLWCLSERDMYLDVCATQPEPFSEPNPKLSRCSRMAAHHYLTEMWSLGLIAIVSCLYGGLHASLWRAHFPTVTERWIWRCSSVMVAGNGFFLGLLSVVETWLDRSRPGGYWAQHSISNRLSWKASVFLEHFFGWSDSVATCVLYLTVYTAALQFIFVFCQVFLLIEAFISLRSQPPSAYDTPNWSWYWPHL